MQAGFTFLILSTLISFLIAPFVIDILYQMKVVRMRGADDSIKKIKARKDKLGTPMMGGIIIIIAVLLVTIAFNWNSSTQIPIIIFIICAALGAIDDFLNIFGKRKRKHITFKHHLKLALHHKKLSRRVILFIEIPWAFYKSLINPIGSRYGTGLYPHERILIQLVAGAIAVYYIYFERSIHTLWMGGNTYINIGVWMIPLILLIIIATANAVNITDGLDGLSAGVMVAAFMAFFAIALTERNEPMVILTATVVGALVTYLYFNIKPARVQMGDIGTLALGSLLGIIALILQKELILIIVGGVFLIETISVIIQKISKKYFHKKVFLMAPLHHHLELKGWSEEKIVMRLWLLSFALAILGVWLTLL